MHNAIIHVPPSPSAGRGGGLSFGRLWEMRCAFVYVCVFLLCGRLFGCDFPSVCVCVRERECESPQWWRGEAVGVKCWLFGPLSKPVSKTIKTAISDRTQLCCDCETV